MEKETILITGCGGMLGEAAYNILKNHYNVIATDIDCNQPWLSYLDVRDLNSYFVVINKELQGHPDRPDITKIFHLAALTDLEYCETNPNEAFLTNSLGVENSVKVAKELHAELVYISTAGIFDDPAQEQFTDYDIPNPKSVYGKSKYMGEIIAQRYEKHYIFRAGWMMGGYAKDKKFVGKILKQIKDGATELYAVDDKLGTPTYTYDFINNMLFFVNHEIYGLYNQVCKGDCSRYDVAKEIVEDLGLNIPVVKVSSNYFGNEYFAPRPYSEKLINLKLRHMGVNNMRYWRVCLKEYLSSNKFKI